eukprot:3930230-Prymnesium_polylepis.1
MADVVAKGGIGRLRVPRGAVLTRHRPQIRRVTHTACRKEWESLTGHGCKRTAGTQPQLLQLLVYFAKSH